MATSIANHDQRVYDPLISACGGRDSVSSQESTPSASPSQSSTPLPPSSQIPSAIIEATSFECEERRILDTLWSYGISRRTLINNPTSTRAKKNFREAQECVRAIIRDSKDWDPRVQRAAKHALSLLLALHTLP